jgi:hypothetical protein
VRRAKQEVSHGQGNKYGEFLPFPLGRRTPAGAGLTAQNNIGGMGIKPATRCSVTTGSFAVHHHPTTYFPCGDE